MKTKLFIMSTLAIAVLTIGASCTSEQIIDSYTFYNDVRIDKVQKGKEVYFISERGFIWGTLGNDSIVIIELPKEIGQETAVLEVYNIHNQKPICTVDEGFVTARLYPKQKVIRITRPARWPHAEYELRTFTGDRFIFEVGDRLYNSTSLISIDDDTGLVLLFEGGLQRFKLTDHIHNGQYKAKGERILVKTEFNSPLKK